LRDWVEDPDRAVAAFAADGALTATGLADGPLAPALPAHATEI